MNALSCDFELDFLVDFFFVVFLFVVFFAMIVKPPPNNRLLPTLDSHHRLHHLHPKMRI
jgi:hypothetical protein